MCRIGGGNILAMVRAILWMALPILEIMGRRGDIWFVDFVLAIKCWDFRVVFDKGGPGFMVLYEFFEKLIEGGNVFVDGG